MLPCLQCEQNRCWRWWAVETSKWRRAARKSLVMLKNNDSTLPISPANVLVAGAGADSIEMQTGGWTITWQGTGNSNETFPGATSIFAGIQQAMSDTGGSAGIGVDGSFTQRPDVAIVVFGETPYAEGQGDVETWHGSKKISATLACCGS